MTRYFRRNCIILKIRHLIDTSSVGSDTGNLQSPNLFLGVDCIYIPCYPLSYAIEAFVMPETKDQR